MSVLIKTAEVRGGVDEPTVERVGHPGILPLEIWDLCVGRTTLGKWSHDPGFAAALATALEALRAGDGITLSKGPLPSMVAGFEAVFLGGGRIQNNGALRSLRLSCPVFCNADGPFTAGSGGFDLLRARGLTGWVVDLGQSQLKIMTSHGRWVFLRDRTRLRVSGNVSTPEVPSQRRRLREFVSLKLQLVMAEAGRPEALVLGLPARITVDGSPRSSTYAGMRDDRALPADILRMTGLHDIPLFLLNDAELAALSARCDPRLTSFNKVLVLTLGYGIGAALMQRVQGTL